MLATNADSSRRTNIDHSLRRVPLVRHELITTSSLVSRSPAAIIVTVESKTLTKRVSYEFENNANINASPRGRHNAL